MDDERRIDCMATTSQAPVTPELSRPDKKPYHCPELKVEGLISTHTHDLSFSFGP